MSRTLKLFTAAVVLTMFGCAQSNGFQNPGGPPPGMLWPGAEAHGYSEVYVTADVLARPDEDVISLMRRTQRAMTSVSCHGPRQVSLMTVVSEEGRVLGVHPQPEIRGECVLEAERILKDVRFSPAMLNDEPVRFMMSFRINLE